MGGGGAQVKDQAAFDEVKDVTHKMLLQAKQTLAASMESILTLLVQQTVESSTMKFPCVFAKYCSGFDEKADGNAQSEFDSRFGDDLIDLERNPEAFIDPLEHPLLDDDESFSETLGHLRRLVVREDSVSGDQLEGSALTMVQMLQ